MSEKNNTQNAQMQFHKFEAAGDVIEGVLTGYVKTNSGYALVIDGKHLIGVTEGIKKCLKQASQESNIEEGYNIAIILKGIIETKQGNTFHNFELQIQKKGSPKKVYLSENYEKAKLSDLLND